MSRSIKLQNNTYLDSTGITHNRELLSTILNNLKPVVLYNNSSGASTNIALSDNYTNYTYFDITFQDTWCGCLFTQRVDRTFSNYFMAHTNISRSGYNGFMSMAKQFYFDTDNKLKKNPYADCVGIYYSYYQNTYQWYTASDYDMKVVRVVGYK